MKSAQVQKHLVKEFKSKSFYFWFAVRLISAFGTLVVTYIFAKGVEAIENKKSFEDILQVFLILLVFELVWHVTRLSSKTKLSIIAENVIVDLQVGLTKKINPSKKLRKPVVQTLRNLTQATRGFTDELLLNSTPGIISFVSVPIILFFVDKRVFVLELALIVLYLLINFAFSKKYEKDYEEFDFSREGYYSRLIEGDKVNIEAKSVVSKYTSVKKVWFLEWLSLQNLVSIFNFIIVFILIGDLIEGTKQISDLILIVGYTKESKAFLNQTTSIANKYMEVKAGIERVEVVSEGKEQRIW